MRNPTSTPHRIRCRERNPIKRIITLRRKLYKPRTNERKLDNRLLRRRRIRHRPTQIPPGPHRRRRQRVDNLPTNRDGQPAYRLRARLLDVVVVLESVCGAGEEVGHGLGEGGGGRAATVEDAEVRAVVGLVGVVRVRLHVAIAAEDPGGRVGACAGEVIFEGGVEEGLGWLGGAGCGWEIGGCGCGSGGNVCG